MAGEAFYLPAGEDTFHSTPATAGPWDAGAQHGGPPSALVVRAFERCAPDPDQRLASLRVDLLGPVPVADLEVGARVVRAGRRITLLEGEVRADGRAVALARGWRLRRAPADGPDVPAPGPVPPLPPPGPALVAGPGFHHEGYLSAVEWRETDGAFTRRGPGTVWGRPRLPLVAGEATSPAALALLLADSGSGISSAVDYSRWLCVNVDLTVVLRRDPVGPWVVLQATTAVSPGGSGAARTALGDREGWFGDVVQTLVLDRRGPAGI